MFEPREVSSQAGLGTRRMESGEGQRESEQGGPVSEASSGTDCGAGSSVRKKIAAVCDQPPGLDELAGHIEAPNMGGRWLTPPGHNDARPVGHIQPSLRKRQPGHDQSPS